MPKIIGLILITVIGVLCGLSGAAQFNLSGLVWSGDGFGYAPYWDPMESDVGVGLALIWLLVWLASLVATAVVSRTGAATVGGMKVKSLGIALISLSSGLTVAALILALVVLPAQYSWMYY